MKKDISISLVVPVYKGGEYWKECIESINKYGYGFDEVLVSINKSDLQNDDIKYFKSLCKLDNVTLIVQNKSLSPLKHFLSYIELIQNDYIFMLAHDDILLEGSLKVKNYLKQHGKELDISLFGSQSYFDDNNKYLGEVNELRGLKNAISSQCFVEYDLGKHFDISLSGITFPTKSIVNNSYYLEKFVRGIRVDYFFLTNCDIKFIHQLEKNTAKVRRHPNQESAIIGLEERTFDSIIYYVYHIKYSLYNKILYEKLIRHLLINILKPLIHLRFYGLIFYCGKLRFFIKFMGMKNYLKMSFSMLKIGINEFIRQIKYRIKI